MKRPTLLLALLVVILAFRPGSRSAELAGEYQAAAEPGRITGTVTRAGTTDPLPEALITTLRGAVIGPGQIAVPNVNGARAGNFRPFQRVQADSLWQWLSMPAVAARGAAPVQWRTVTDAMGQFTIENLRPGEYVVNVQLEGYFGPTAIGMPTQPLRTPATVTSGKTTEVNFAMIPGGAISGRVLDPKGRPVVDTQIQAMRMTYQTDGSAALQAAGNRTTDDRGDYRLFRLPPGEYYVVATPRVTAAANALGEAALRETQVRTFYPAASSPALASPIVIRGGEELTGANIQFRNVPLAKISGRVINALPLSAFDPPAQRGQAAAIVAAANADPSLQPFVEELNRAQAAVAEARGRLQEARGIRDAPPLQPAERPLPAVQLQLFPRDRSALVDPNAGNRSISAAMALPNDGRFEFPNVPPGSYELFASLPDNTAYGPNQASGQATNGRSFGRVSIDVGDSDVNDITVTVHQGTDVRGRVIVDGRPTTFTGAHIVLQPDDGAARVNIYQMVARSEATIAADGTFVIPAVPEGAYRVQVTLGGPSPAQRGQPPLDPATIEVIRNQVQAGGNTQALLAEARGRQQAQLSAEMANIKAYVVDVRQNSASIYDSGFVIGSGAINPIDIHVDTNAGSVTGTVTGADQKPVSGATVVLVPPAHRRRNTDLYRSATTTIDGKFTLGGLPPGEFKLFAWQSLPGTIYLNPSFIAPYEERGVPASISAGGLLTTDLTVIKD